jgi:ABC-type nitrate/sulfonate/bicarbonate transport system ATPase subunit
VLESRSRQSVIQGQKARVNMALLDDPLSAVDAKVSKHLFEQ